MLADMKWNRACLFYGYALLLIALALHPVLVGAHIHSHKVKHVHQSRVSSSTWVYSLVSSAAVGACGVFPLLFNRWVRLDSAGCKDKPAFRTVLSFAVGGLLGDVFLHILPEAWGSREERTHNDVSLGLWIIVGLFSFMMVEKLANMTDTPEASSKNEIEEREKDGVSSTHKAFPIGTTSNGFRSSNINTINHNTSTNNNTCTNNNTSRSNCCVKPMISKRTKTVPSPFSSDLNSLHHHYLTNGSSCQPLHSGSSCTKTTTKQGTTTTTLPNKRNSSISDFNTDTPLPRNPWLQKDITGYLNLVANCTDNFTHGLAIATSYVASPMVGLLTTLAIICHEIPHEIGDFAILLNSGFNLREATKAQVCTACGGLVGVVVGLTAEHFSSASTWLLPFTAGGFLYIALISIIPDLLRVKDSMANPRQTMIEVIAIVMGIVVMAMVTIVEKKSCGHMPVH